MLKFLGFKLYEIDSECIKKKGKFNWLLICDTCGYVITNKQKISFRDKDDHEFFTLE